MSMTLLIVIGVLVVLAGWAIGVYNGLVQARNRFKNAFAQIDVQLKRRYDLIPNLVETAKGYMKHERETLEAVIAARNQAFAAANAAAAAPTDGAAMRALAGAEGALRGVLGRLMVVVEQYPDLKANQNMMQPRRRSPPPRTASPSPVRPTTTRSWRTTPAARCFLAR